jgi:hypothetical protein
VGAFHRRPGPETISHADEETLRAVVTAPSGRVPSRCRQVDPAESRRYDRALPRHRGHRPPHQKVGQFRQARTRRIEPIAPDYLANHGLPSVGVSKCQQPIRDLSAKALELHAGLDHSRSFPSFQVDSDVSLEISDLTERTRA